MSDTLSPALRHYTMSRVRSSNTKPEVRLRHALWSQGFRYKVNDKRLPGKPDIVLPKYRSVIFVHGCFWHGHSGCSKYTIPKTNTDFWVNKVNRNRERDQEVWRHLEAKGWHVIIVWECELEKKQLEETVARIGPEIIENGHLSSQKQLERKASREKRKIELEIRKAAVASHMAEVSRLSQGIVCSD